MGIRLKAAARTAKLFAFATLVPAVIIFLFKLDADTLFELFLLSFLAWMIWVVYQINLTQVENEEEVKKMQERQETMLSSIVKHKE